MQGKCGSLNDSPPKRSTSHSPEPVNVLAYMAKGTLQMSIHSRILKWEIMLDYMGGPSVLIKRRQEGQSQILEDARLLALKMEDGATS